MLCCNIRAAGKRFLSPSSSSLINYSQFICPTEGGTIDVLSVTAKPVMGTSVEVCK